MDNNNKPLVEVNYGLASVYDDVIEVNYKLTDKLRDSVIKHERSHRTGSYSKEDFLVDFQAKNSHFKESIMFCITNPEAWINFFPLMYSYYSKAWTFNYSASIPFIYFGLIFSGFWWLLFKVNFLNSFICYSIGIILLNFLLLGVTHYNVRKDGDFGYKVIKN